MELLRITRQIHCKAVEQRATLIHRQYNRDWGTSYSSPPIDPYLTSPLLQNAGGATATPPTPLGGGDLVRCSQRRTERAEVDKNHGRRRIRLGPEDGGACLGPTRRRDRSLCVSRRRRTDRPLDPLPYSYPRTRLYMATKHTRTQTSLTAIFPRLPG